MRDLAALNIYSMGEFEMAKTFTVRKADQCIAAENKLLELKQALSNLELDKDKYENKGLVGRVRIRLESAINFVERQRSAFSGGADAVDAARAELENRRTNTLRKLADSKLERKAEIDAAKAKIEVPAAPEPEPEYLEPSLKAVPVAKKKAGRPKKKK